MNIALLEVSHWHGPLYFDALESAEATVVAVSDPHRPIADKVAARFKARSYADWRALLDAERPEFAFAFGRHCDMPMIGEALIARGIPFLMEKPCGLSAAHVRRLRDAARARGLFAAVPLVQGLGPLGEAVGASLRGGGPHHAWFRFIAGPPQRYPAAGCAWMLDPVQSGGGCFINLSGHFVHLALRLLPRVTRVLAHMSGAVHELAVEDFALVVLESPDGGTATLEMGYLFPNAVGRPREVYYSLLARGGCHVFSRHRVGHAAPGQPWQEVPIDLEIDPLFATFVRATLASFREGRAAPVGLDEMVAVMEVIDAAYVAARTGQPVSVDIPGLVAASG